MCSVDLERGITEALVRAIVPSVVLVNGEGDKIKAFAADTENLTLGDGGDRAEEAARFFKAHCAKGLWLRYMAERDGVVQVMEQAGLMQEFGSWLRHSDEPNFRCGAFADLVTNKKYFIMFPIKDVEPGEECTRDHCLVTHSAERSARLVSWLKANQWADQSQRVRHEQAAEAATIGAHCSKWISSAAGVQSSHQFEYRGKTIWPAFIPLNYPPPLVAEVTADLTEFATSNREEVERLRIPAPILPTMHSRFREGAKPLAGALALSGGIVTAARAWTAPGDVVDLLVAKHFVTVSPDSSGEVLPYIPQARGLWEWCQKLISPSARGWQATQELRQVLYAHGLAESRGLALVDEELLRMRHSDTPNFRVVLFRDAKTDKTYALAWALRAVAAGEEATRDYAYDDGLLGLSNSALRSAAIVGRLAPEMFADSAAAASHASRCASVKKWKAMLPATKTSWWQVFKEWLAKRENWVPHKECVLSRERIFVQSDMQQILQDSLTLKEVTFVQKLKDANVVFQYTGETNFVDWLPNKVSSASQSRCSCGHAWRRPRKGWARSRCRCGRGEPSPSTDVEGVRPVPVQTWKGCVLFGAGVPELPQLDDH